MVVATMIIAAVVVATVVIAAMVVATAVVAADCHRRGRCLPLPRRTGLDLW